MVPIVIASSGVVSARLIHKRPVMLRNSELSSGVVTVRGSSAMPQIGQFPVPVRIISGCIGHAYSILVDAIAGDCRSSAMPHFGHGPGFACCTTGHIGQT